MPKWSHDNPHAERAIVELDLRSWESQRQRATRERESARRERERLALAAVPWDELSPAELAFRWMLEHDWASYVAWCEATRAGTAQR